MTGGEARIVRLGARVHLFVHPSAREAFQRLFRDALGCSVAELEFGLAHPILLVQFGDGSGFSVEFSDLAPMVSPAEPIDDRRAFRGAWIEFRTPDVDAVQTALRQAGVPEFRHAGSSHAYFAAPGGQVFRVLDIGYSGP